MPPPAALLCSALHCNLTPRNELYAMRAGTKGVVESEREGRELLRGDRLITISLARGRGYLGMLPGLLL